MEDVRFFYQQANRCYQLAWQSFDLRVAQKLNLLGNEHTAKARELRSQETAESQTKKLAAPRSANSNCLSPGLPRGFSFPPAARRASPNSRAGGHKIADSDLINLHFGPLCGAQGGYLTRSEN